MAHVARHLVRQHISCGAGACGYHGGGISSATWRGVSRRLRQHLGNKRRRSRIIVSAYLAAAACGLMHRAWRKTAACISARTSRWKMTARQAQLRAYCARSLTTARNVASPSVDPRAVAASD